MGNTIKFSLLLPNVFQFLTAGQSCIAGANPRRANFWTFETFYSSHSSSEPSVAPARRQNKSITLDDAKYRRVPAAFRRRTESSLFTLRSPNQFCLGQTKAFASHCFTQIVCQSARPGDKPSACGEFQAFRFSVSSSP